MEGKPSEPTSGLSCQYKAAGGVDDTADGIDIATMNITSLLRNEARMWEYLRQEKLLQP